MTDMDMSPEFIELLNDAVKIGLPGLIGLFAGFFPYFIQQKKLEANERQENINAKRNLVISFTDALSSYIGSTNAYISCLILSKESFEAPHSDPLHLRAAEAMLDNEINRIKAKSLAGLVGDINVIDALLDYDSSLSQQLNYLASISKIDNDIFLNFTAKKEISERRLLITLSSLT